MLPLLLLAASHSKFKAWKEAATIPVDSTGISVWDLKSQIITANNLANSAKDFDLQLFNSQSGEGPFWARPSLSQP